MTGVSNATPINPGEEDQVSTIDLQSEADDGCCRQPHQAGGAKTTEPEKGVHHIGAPVDCVMRVAAREQLTDDIFAVKLMGPFPADTADPGQFVMVQIGDGTAHPLRRPLSIAEVTVLTSFQDLADGEETTCFDEEVEALAARPVHDQEQGIGQVGTRQLPRAEVTLVFRALGKGTGWLSGLELGRTVRVLGPLGKGFPLGGVSKDLAKVLIIGGGVGIPPLYELAKRLSRFEVQMQIRLGWKSLKDAFWIDRFKQLGQVKVFTEDGTLGEKGFVTDGLRADMGAWDGFYACGPIPMLQQVCRQLESADIPGFISLEERMACGVGACLGCVIPAHTSSGYARVCADGPVFDFHTVNWAGWQREGR